MVVTEKHEKFISKDVNIAGWSTKVFMHLCIELQTDQL